MNKKIIGGVIIFIGILAIAGIIYMLFFNKPSSEEPTKKTEPTSNVDKTNTDQTVKDVVTPKRRINANITNDETIKDENGTGNVNPDDFSKEDLKRIAGSFVERFGSYSNQSNYSNIKDLRMFMSDKMRNWADSFIAEQIKKASANDIYYGIITKASTEEIVEYNDEAGLVTILVQTRRREAVGASANFSDVYNQSVVVNFVKDRGAWKVDSANWNEK